MSIAGKRDFLGERSIFGWTLLSSFCKTAEYNKNDDLNAIILSINIYNFYLGSAASVGLDCHDPQKMRVSQRRACSYG
jgi:hypothetical protein